MTPDEEVPEDDPHKENRVPMGKTGKYFPLLNHRRYDPFDMDDEYADEKPKPIAKWRMKLYKFLRGGLLHWLSQRDDDRAPWRVKLGNFVEHRYAEIALAILLLADVCVVIAEIIIVDIACRGGKEVEEVLHGPEEALHWTSISILSVFCLELFLTFIAHDFAMFKHLGYVLDTIIIPTALFLELFLDDVAGLLVLLRLWRLIRVAHGAVEILHKVEKDLARKKLRKRLQEIEHHYITELEHRDEIIKKLSNGDNSESAVEHDKDQNVPSQNGKKEL